MSYYTDETVRTDVGEAVEAYLAESRHLVAAGKKGMVALTCTVHDDEAPLQLFRRGLALTLSSRSKSERADAGHRLTVCYRVRLDR